MSQDVKRWTAADIAIECDKLGGFRPDAEFVQAPEHDRVVAELKAEIENMKVSERSWLVAKELELGGMFSGQLSELKDENERLKRVVEKLLPYAQHRVDCICRAGVLEYSESCDCGLEKELDAIEKVVP